MELKKGTHLQGGKYKIEQTLGQGSFGITYLAIAKFSTKGNLGKMDVEAKVAIKEFFMSEINSRKEDGSTVEGSTGSIFTNYKNRFRKEAENLSKLLHPNIVKVFDVFDENNTTYYVMEYLSDTNLNKYIKNKNGLSETECIAFTEQIGGALQYMHDSFMLHLDLKPGNIMLRNNEAVLIDFGLSKQFNAKGQPETSTTIGQGTQGYAPLEQQNYNGRQSKGLPFAMDVYALGGTMFKMITGQTPPDASSIFNDGFPKKELAVHNISTRLGDIIEKAMAPSKKERYQTVIELLLAIDPSKIVSRKYSISKSVSSVDDDKKSEDLTRLEQDDCSKAMILTGSEAALKAGVIISSPNGSEYVIDRVFVGGFNFTYFCHYSNNPPKKVVVKELFFIDNNCRKNGTVSSLGNVDWIDRYQQRFTEFGRILKTLSGYPYIENYVDSFKANGTYYIVTDFIYGETLSDIQEREKRNFTEKEVINIIKQICTGLRYLKAHNILHLDIKPSNIIKSSNQYVLLDFGMSKVQSDRATASDTKIGYTPGFSSIEQQEGSGNLTSASDIYSIGATMYKLLTGLTPKSATEILQEGFQSLESELKNNNVSVDLIKVIKIAMSPSIKNRYQSPESLSKAISSIKLKPYTRNTLTSGTTNENNVLSKPQKENSNLTIKDNTQHIDSIDKINSKQNSKSRNDEKNHKSNETRNCFLDSVANFLENIWHSTWTPFLSLFVWTFSFIVASVLEKKYWGGTIIPLTLSILFVNICSFICDRTLDDLIRRICAGVALFAIGIYSMIMIISFFPDRLQSILSNFV